MIRRFGLGDRIVLSSFNHYTLLRCKAIAPELPCGILYECRIAEPQTTAGGLTCSICTRLSLSKRRGACQIRASRLKTSPWTVDQDADIRYLIKQPNIFAIMSNKPDRVHALRAEA